MTAKIIKPKVFETLNVLPEITNLQIEHKDKFYIFINYKLKSKLIQNKTNWIFDSKTVNLFNINIILSFNTDLTTFLTKNENLLFNQPIPVNFEINKDYIKISRKINESDIKNAIINNDELYSIFKDKVQYNSSEISHLTLFISSFMDNNEVSKIFSLNSEKFKNIIGISSNENYIKNSNITNDKLINISSLTDKTKFNFNSLSFKNDTIENILKIKTQLLNKSNNSLYFSELYESFNSNLEFSGIFILNCENIFKIESKYPGFFNIKNFNDVFFSNIKNYLPSFIRIIRIDKFTKKSEIILEEQYKDLIDIDKCKFSIVSKENNKKLILSFLDKDSKKLSSKYYYEIYLEFNDKTISYLDSIFNNVINELKNIQEIINISNNGNYYNSEFNIFNNQLNEDLKTYNLSIEKSIKSTANILTRFFNVEQNFIQNILNLIKLNNFNFDILYSLLDILSFLKSEITLLKNKSLNTESNKISILKKFTNIDFSIKNNNFINLFNLNEDKPFSLINKSDFINNANTQIEKYYTTNQINISNKYSFLTPKIISTKYKNINQNKFKLDNINHNEYNELLIDLYMSKLYKGNYSTMSLYERLIFLLNYYGIYKIIEVNNININSISISRTSNAQNKQPDNFETENEILFQIFVECIFKNNSNVNNFSSLIDGSSKSNIDKFSANTQPFQSLSIIQSSQNNELTRLNSELVKTLTESNKVFSSYLNFKKIYKLEYLDVNDLKWKELDDNTIDNLKFEIILRYIPYTNVDENISSETKINFFEANQVFVIKP